jgi:hypothetical protein
MTCYICQNQKKKSIMKKKTQNILMFKKNGIVELNSKNLIVIKGGDGNTGGVDTGTGSSSRDCGVGTGAR